MTNSQNVIIVSFLSVFLFISAYMHLDPFSAKISIEPVRIKSLFGEIMEKRKIDINRASLEQIISIPGIGPVLAKNICEYRKNNGNFTVLDDLINVKGIGPKKLETITLYSKIK